jgi:hypothetical protein
MKKLFCICMVAAMYCLMATASAGPVIQVGQGGTPPATVPAGDRCLTVWCQEPTNNYSIESQISAVPEEVVFQIADFTSPSDEAVTRMQWWGGVFGGTGPVEHFVITFYFSGGCSGPAGEAIYERIIHTWTELEYDEYGLEYSATFDPVPMDAGQNYWVSVQAVMDIDPGGYWLWRCSTLELCPAMALAPSYGVMDWTVVYPVLFPDDPGLEERAFCLYSDGAVLTEISTWDKVKTLYR